MMISLICCGGLLGAMSQRTTGMGFALIALPFFSLSVGPLPAVVLATAAGGLVCGYLTVALRRSIDWGRVRSLVPWGIAGVVPGSLLAASVDKTTLQLVIGWVLLGALLLQPAMRLLPQATFRMPTSLAGAVSGFTGALSGTPGVPLIIYAETTGWDGRDFAASAQPVYVSIGAAVATTQFTASAAVMRTVPVSVWSLTLLAVTLGTMLSRWLVDWVSPGLALTTARILAVAGATQMVLRAML